MNKINKLLTLIFLIFLILIIVESVYYFKWQSDSTKSGANLTTTNNSKKFSAKAVNALTAQFSVEKVDSNTVYVIFNGVITNIENKHQVKSTTGLVCDYIFTGKDSNSNKVNKFCYSKEDVGDTQKMSIKEGNKIIPLSSIKVGDNVSIKETLDLTKEIKDSTVKVEIIKKPN